MYTGFQEKYSLFKSDFNEIWMFSIYEKKHSNIKFHEHTSSGRRGFPCGQTDMTKQIVDVRNFAKAPKNNYTNIYTLVFIMLIASTL